MTGKLTQQQVDDATSDGKPRRELRDGRGLFLMVLASGKRTFYLRRTRDGKTVQRKIGDASTMTLDEARRLAPHAFDPKPEAPKRDPEIDELKREIREPAR